MEIIKEDFNFLQTYIKEVCGLVVPNEKEYLIKQRIAPVVLENKLSGFSELCKKLKIDTIVLKNQIIEAITTNETFFFRDIHPFKAFETKILPILGEKIRKRKSLIPQRKGSKVRIWCAASSTGQEAYSLSMLINEYTNRYRGLEPSDFSILSTDISSGVLAQAMEGRFTQLEMNRGLSTELRNKYFHLENHVGFVKAEVKDLVEFKRLNLQSSFLHLGGFDVIFCRNVLIYFDDKMKKNILDQCYQLLSEDGFLLLGASENVYGITDRFSSVKEGSTQLYQKGTT